MDGGGLVCSSGLAGLVGLVPSGLVIPSGLVQPSGFSEPSGSVQFPDGLSGMVMLQPHSYMDLAIHSIFLSIIAIFFIPLSCISSIFSASLNFILIIFITESLNFPPIVFIFFPTRSTMHIASSSLQQPPQDFMQFLDIHS